MMLSVFGGGSGGRQFMAPVGGAGEKFSIFFDPNELKSPKKQHLFLLFFFYKGWVIGSENSIDIFIII